jgi:U3 small nucleolar RNA-associated protein 7
MIALDPEFVGSLAPPSKLTGGTNDDGRSAEVPFARLPRLERLRVQGKADETELTENEEDANLDVDAKKIAREEREKKKMRGKNKSLKRFVLFLLLLFFFCRPVLIAYS